ncbi:hypothetical protein B0H12DRAFT_1232162 [Mycena haematopus]|nr:hypothetical protein B0H12DRAFT_1232162 [Mycena haematopus]
MRFVTYNLRYGSQPDNITVQQSLETLDPLVSCVAVAANINRATVNLIYSLTPFTPSRFPGARSHRVCAPVRLQRRHGWQEFLGDFNSPQTGRDSAAYEIATGKRAPGTLPADFAANYSCPRTPRRSYCAARDFHRLHRSERHAGVDSD